MSCLKSHARAATFYSLFPYKLEEFLAQFIDEKFMHTLILNEQKFGHVFSK